jgi:N-acetyl-anhydromuramyl-L-alanine amidase AmpD
MHWTAGTHVVSSVDRKHYHLIVAGDGSVVSGTHRPEDNISTADNHYAAHTRACNTGSIGVAVAAMHGAAERPFSAGGFPIREVQVDALVKLVADLCRRYAIPVTPRTVLTHAEVQPTLGIRQNGKWDIRWLPGMNSPADPIAVGNVLRNRIIGAMK